MGVEGNDNVVPVFQILRHELHLIGINVGHGDRDSDGEVDDDLPLRSGLPDIEDGVADVKGKLHFGAGEAFGGILIAEVPFKALGILIKELGAGNCDVDDLLFGFAEDLLPLSHGGGIIKVDDGVFAAL